MPVKALEVGALVKSGRRRRTLASGYSRRQGGCRVTLLDRETLCAGKVHGDRVNNQYSGIYELNTYRK